MPTTAFEPIAIALVGLFGGPSIPVAYRTTSCARRPLADRRSRSQLDDYTPALGHVVLRDQRSELRERALPIAK